MTVSISTLSLYRQTAGTVNRLQQDFAVTSNEVATLFKNDVAGDLGVRGAGLVDLRNSLSRIEVHEQSLSRFSLRTDLIQSALGAVEERAGEVFARLGTVASDFDPLADTLPDLARNALNEITDLLNSQGDGIYLFSGVDTDTRPLVRPTENPGTSPLEVVAAAAVPNPPATIADAQALAAAIDGVFAPAAFEADFYQGTPAAPGAPRLAARVDDDTTISYGVQANDAAFRDILQGLHMLAVVDPASLPNEIEPPLTENDPRNSPYAAYMGAALDKIGSGIDSLRTIRANLGQHQAQADGVSEQLEARRILFASEISNLEQVDPFETQIRLQAIQGQLESSFQVTARVSRLTLSNFL